MALHGCRQAAELVLEHGARTRHPRPQDAGNSWLVFSTWIFIEGLSGRDIEDGENTAALFSADQCSHSLADTASQIHVWFGIWGNSEPQPHTHWQWLPVCKCFKLIGAEVQREMRGWDLLALMHRLRGTAFKWSKPMQ